MLLFWKCLFTWSVPFRVADTFSTLALSVIRTRAQFTFKTITRKVVAFAIIPWHNLQAIQSYEYHFIMPLLLSLPLYTYSHLSHSKTTSLCEVCLCFIKLYLSPMKSHSGQNIALLCIFNMWSLSRHLSDVEWSHFSHVYSSSSGLECILVKCCFR